MGERVAVVSECPLTHDDNGILQNNVCPLCRKTQREPAGKYAAIVDRTETLRLLAAETSERLGVSWSESVKPMWFADKLGVWIPGDDGPRFAPVGERGLTPDELLAALHGSFLLADAMKQEGV